MSTGRAVRRWVLADVLFAGVTFLLVALTYTPLAGPLNTLLCAVSYRGATSVLDALSIPYAADAAARTLSRGSFSLEVTGLCSGLRGIALLGAVMVLLPAPRRQKLVHFAVGAAALTLVNVARIAHLYYLGAEGSPRFTLFHEWIWPAGIVCAILLYRLAFRLSHGPEATPEASPPVEMAHG